MTRLDESATMTADGAGRAVVRLIPLRAFERWRVTNTSITTTSVLIPSFRLFRHSEAPSNQIGSTYDGNQNNNADLIELENGEALVGVWEGATPGAQCTMKVVGTREGR